MARLQRALQQRLDAGADHRARLVVRHRRDAWLRQNDVERVDEIGRGVDQRAVEIEDQNGGGHGGHLRADMPRSLTVGKSAGKAPGMGHGLRPALGAGRWQAACFPHMIPGRRAPGSA